MKLKYLIAGAALGLPLMMAAVPVKPGIIKVTNPDGTQVEIQHRGDENFAYTVDAQGKYILELDAKGNWAPAMRNGLALTAEAANIDLIRAEQQTASPARSAADRNRMAQLDNLGRSLFPCKGKVRSAVVLVEYSDRKFTLENPKQVFSDLCNKQGYDSYGAMGSARDYFVATSDGQFDVEFDVYGPVQIPYTAAYITGEEQAPGTGKYKNFHVLIKSALEILDEQGVDFSIYDYDNDNILDNVFFYYAGYGQADHFTDKGELMHDLVWPHQSDYSYYGNLMLDGKKMGPYACASELAGSCTLEDPRPAGIGTFCHEFGHVLGLPDLYNTSTTPTEEPGSWTIMCSGSYNMNSNCPPLFAAYEKWVCGCSEYNTAQENSEIVLKPNADTPAADQFGKPDFRSARISIPGYSYGSPSYAGDIYPDEYFIVENRTQKGFDQSLPSEGLTMWQIRYNKSIWRSNKVNSNGTPRVRILSVPDAGGAKTWNSYTRSYLLPTDLKWYSVSDNWKPYLTGISYDSETKEGKFEYNMINGPVEDTTNVHWLGKHEENKRNVFSIYWNEVPGAEKYLLTVYYLDANGNKRYINGLNETDMGTAHWTTVRNITTNQWNSEIHAYVRVFNKIPSDKTSPELVFKPTEIRDWDETDGVENVEISTMISAGQGCIYAPEGAKVFTLSGMQTGTENLAKGIYIVTYGGKAVKVAVK